MMSNSVPARRSEWIVCGQIEHTQGASEFALLGYLTLVLTAARRLKHVHLHVVMPTSDGLPLDQLYTRGSLDELARTHGFEWASGARHNCSQLRPPKAVKGSCDSADFINARWDARIGVATALSPRAAAFVRSRGLALPNFTATKGAAGDLATFHDSVLRFLLALQPLPASKEAPVVRIGLLLCQGAPSPLAYAPLLFRSEALAVLQNLAFSPTIEFPLAPAWAWLNRSSEALREYRRRASGVTLAASGCSYAFFGGWSARTTFHLEDSTWVAAPSFHHAARSILRLSLDAGLTCAVVNVLPTPRESLGAVASIFQNETRHLLNESADFQVVHVLKSRDPGVAQARNLHEHWAASITPLLIVDAGTHWADWALAARAAAGEASAVVDGTGWWQMCDEANDYCRRCFFLRAECFNASAVSDVPVVQWVRNSRRICTYESPAGLMSYTPHSLCV